MGSEALTGHSETSRKTREGGKKEQEIEVPVEVVTARPKEKADHLEVL
jgi:hypothetical protein